MSAANDTPEALAVTTRRKALAETLTRDAPGRALTQRALGVTAMREAPPMLRVASGGACD